MLWNRQGICLHPGNLFFPNHDIRMGRKKILIVKGDIPDNPKPIGNYPKFVGIAEMPIDVHLLDGGIASGMGWQGAISGFIQKQ